MASIEEADLGSDSGTDPDPAEPTDQSTPEEPSGVSPEEPSDCSPDEPSEGSQDEPSDCSPEDPSEAHATRRKGFPRWQVAGAASVVLCGALIGLLVAAVGSGSSPASALVAAANQTGSSSAHLEVVATLSGASGSFEETANGDADIASQTADFTLELGSPATSNLSYEVRSVGKTIYLRSTNGSGPFGSGKWYAYTVDSPQAQFSPLVTFNAHQLLSLLQSKGATVSSAGEGAIGGQQMQKYLVRLGPGAGAGDALAQDLGAHVQGLTVWVGGDGYVHRVTLGLELSGLGSSSAGAVGMQITVDLSKFGEPLHITAPPPSEVVSGGSSA